MNLKRYICIEGCMGAGKTTLAREMATALDATPLIEDTARHPFIRDFYADPSAYALETELAFILIHYHQVVRENLAGVFQNPVVSDFAFERDLVFARNTLKVPGDQALFRSAYELLSTRLPKPDLLIYLKAPLELLADRMAKRGRDYEKNIPRDYLKTINETLDAYFLSEYQGPVLVFNVAELDASINPRYVETVLARLS
jgi:deoxyguanosine kinase